jgi:hypothetical protein
VKIAPTFAIAAAATISAVFSGSPAAAQAANPPIAGCEQVLSAADYDDLRTQVEDPLAVFERWRRAHRSMIEASPKIVCRHKAWLVLHGLASPGSLTSSEPEMALPPSPSTTTVGANAALAGGVSDYQGETAIAVDPNDAQKLVSGANTFFQDPTAACQSPTGGSANTFGTQALYGSADGGSTWTYNCSPWPSSLTGGIPGATAWFGSDPAMAWDNAGNAYAAYLLISADNSNHAGSAVVVAKSTDGGLTWPRANTGIVVNHITSTSIFDDKEMMAIDTSVGGAHSHTNRIYVIWDENNVEKVAHADTLGGSWTTATIGNGITADIGADIKVGADGTVYAIWNDATNCPPAGGDVTLFRSSTDGGTTWSAQKTVFTHSLGSFCTNNTPPAQDQRGVNAFSSLGVDDNPSSPFFNRLYVATCDFPSGTTSGSNLNIYTVFSTDGGTTWPSSSKVKVNDDTGTSATQFFPWLAVDQSDGSVNVSWYDTRNFTTNNRRAQAFYAHSATGAVSYESNVLISDGGANFVNHVNYCDENSIDNNNFNPNQYGDYSGMAALGLLAHPFWTDTRNFYPNLGPPGDTRVEDAATALLTNSCSTPPTPTAGNNGPICAGQTLQLTASTVAGATYSWSGPNGFSSTQQNPSIPGATTAAAGTYTVIATVASCPSAPGTTTAVVNPGPNPPAAGNNGPVCDGQTLQLTASTISGATYHWTGPNGFSSSLQNPSIPSVTTAASGTYSVTATVNGCTSAPATTNATVNPSPAAPAAGNNGPICAGQTLQLTASFISGAAYHWTGPNGFASSLQNPSIPSATTAASGTYSVTATVNGCPSAPATTAATVNATPSAAVTAPAGVCSGSAGNLASVPSAGAGATYLWTITNGSITAGAGTPSITFTAAASGTLILNVTVQSALGCSASGTRSLPISPQPPAPVASNNGPICTGQTLQLTASAISGAVYSWTGPNGFTSTLQNPSIAGATTATSGLYTVTASVNGCASSPGTTTAQVSSDVATPVVTAPLCAPIGAVGLTASVPAVADTYQWTATGGTIITDPTQPQVSFDVGPPGSLTTLSVVETITGLACPQSDPGIARVQVDYLDVAPSNPFHDFICTLGRDQVTAGCGGGNFCPGGTVLRSQMAVFLLRSEHGPSYDPPPATGIFADVPVSNAFAPWIEQLYNEGITGGCSTNPLLYCPNNSVTRASMAVFLLVAEHGSGYVPPSCAGIFADVPCPGAFTAWIEQLYTEGITGGCGANPLIYCPGNPVTRAQMAVFLTVTFHLP